MNIRIQAYFTEKQSVDLSQSWFSEFQSFIQNKISASDIDMHCESCNQKPEKALFSGFPFLWIGNKKSIDDLKSRLTPTQLILLNDISYYWIIIDQDHTEDSLDWENHRQIYLSWKRTNFNVIWSHLKWLLKTPELIGLSKGMHLIRKSIDRIANGPMGPGHPVLILGESGSGKELAVRAIKNLSPRKNGAFEILPCGWFTENLLQDQLFGHVKGAFSGAFGEKKGLLELSSTGVVFLDDFDSASISIQGALLRIMATPPFQKATYYRLGGESIEKERQTCVWIFFSTNRDISEMILTKDIREDFIFRFEDRVIHLQPLRNRPADIPAISNYYWDHLLPPQKFKLTEPALDAIFYFHPKLQKEQESLRTMLLNAEFRSVDDLIQSVFNLSGYDIGDIYPSVLYIIGSQKMLSDSQIEKIRIYLYKNEHINKIHLMEYIKKIIGYTEDPSIKEKLLYIEIHMPLPEVSGQKQLEDKTIDYLIQNTQKLTGNVRSLRAVLSLCVQLSKQNRNQSIDTILKKILSRGANYIDWMGLKKENLKNQPEDCLTTSVETVRQYVNAGICSQKIQDGLSPEKWQIYLDYLSVIQKKKKFDEIQKRIEMILCYLMDQEEITTAMAAQLTQYKNTTVHNTLKELCKVGLLDTRDNPQSSQQIYYYLAS